MVIFSLGSGCGWWLAIVLLATIKEKLAYSNIPQNLKGMGISFITTGLMAMAFMGLTGIDISQPKKVSSFYQEETEQAPILQEETLSLLKKAKSRKKISLQKLKFFFLNNKGVS